MGRPSRVRVTGPLAPHAAGFRDRRTTFGRRDYAVLTLLSRLGLRAGKVAALSLDGID